VNVEGLCAEIEIRTIQLDGLRLRRTDVSPGSLDRLNETPAARTPQRCPVRDQHLKNRFWKHSINLRGDRRLCRRVCHVPGVACPVVLVAGRGLPKTGMSRHAAGDFRRFDPGSDQARFLRAPEGLAGELGFEPRQTESESVVLPLHHSPINT
jgi:hypothetical protein